MKVEGHYIPGQLFIHKLFGYRGVVLIPWTCKIHDRDNPVISGSNFEEKFPEAMDSTRSISNKKKRTHSYYLILRDNRDLPYIKNRVLTEHITYLNQSSGQCENGIPGLDYVDHQDILPYVTQDKYPIDHPLISKFITPSLDSDNYPMYKDNMSIFKHKYLKLNDHLLNFLKNHYNFLKLTDVHKETTENICVRVLPFYMGSWITPFKKLYWWRYCVYLENIGGLPVQLRERNWRILPVNGMPLEKIRARAVFDHEPVLSKEEPAFQYSAFVKLQSPEGHMWGHFKMEREDGTFFECRIPPFALESTKPDDKPN